MAKQTREQARRRRHARVRKKIRGTKASPRLNVYRSTNNIYAQIIDDGPGETLVQASTKDVALQANLSGKSKTEQATLVGEHVAKRAKKAGVTSVVFDRGGYRYHGRVKALAEASRKSGLEF